MLTFRNFDGRYLNSADRFTGPAPRSDALHQSDGHGAFAAGNPVSSWRSIDPPHLVDLPMDPDIPGNSTTTITLTVGQTVHSLIAFAYDHDWIRIELVAGQSYQFSLSGVGSVDLKNPYLELRDSGGALLASDDDSGPGVDSLLFFTATESGTYYLDAQAFGNETGYYDLGAALAGPQAPTDSIDWGTGVSGSTVMVYFARKGQLHDHQRAQSDWTADEKAAAMAAFGVYADVSNISFVATNIRSDADFILVKSHLDTGALGYFNPPGSTNAGIGVFNYTSSVWTDDALLPGGFAFVTLVHEIGHGLGLAHPHDNGGDSTVMLGVTGPFESYGTGGLNQGVFTTMSYNDGWASGPNGISASENYGWQATLGPIDIALIQQKYGTDTNHNTGNTNYRLADSNVSGTRYQAIWDSSGTDKIFYIGSRDAVIDLRAATLLYAEGGGGYVSYISGIIGGFTIAHGVVVENATTGAGNDSLTGNDADNILTGNGGNDTINGGGGNDIAVFSGNLADYTIIDNSGGSWSVTDMRGGSPDGTDTLTGIETLRFADTDYSAPPPPPDDGSINGDGGDNAIDGTSGNDTINAGGGADRVKAGAGDDIVNGEAGNDTLFGQDGDDTIDGGSGRDVVRGGDGADIISGGSGRDNLRGDAGNDVLRGGSGHDTLQGGDGNDIGAGHGGRDRFIGGAGNDRFNGGAGTDDQADFSGNFADYQLDFLAGNGEVRVTDLRAGSPDGMDRLFSVEVLQFADGVVDINGGSFDFTASAAPVAGPDLASDDLSAKTGDPVMDSLGLTAVYGGAVADFGAAGAGPLSGIGRVPVELLSLQAGTGGIEPADVGPRPGLPHDSGAQFVTPPADWLVDQQGWTPLDDASSGPAPAATSTAMEASAADPRELALLTDMGDPAFAFSPGAEFTGFSQDASDVSGWL